MTWTLTEYGYEVDGEIGDDEHDAASLAAARAECGWHVFPPVKCRYRADSSDTSRIVQLPCTHVSSVESVEVGGIAVAFDWKPGGLVRVIDRVRGDRWGDIVITYVAGIENPRAFLSVVEHNAASKRPGVQSESAGGVSVTYSTDSAASAKGMLSDREAAALWPYKRVGCA